MCEYAGDHDVNSRRLFRACGVVPLRFHRASARMECPASSAAFTVSRPIPLLAPMIRTVATSSCSRVRLAHRHVRCMQPHRKVGGPLRSHAAYAAAKRERCSSMTNSAQPRSACKPSGEISTLNPLSADV